MRLTVVANPRATYTSAAQHQVIVDALRRAGEARVEETSYRGHASALACRAMRDGADVVVAFGGDGTVNEVVNGVLTDGVHTGVPLVAIVPAGSTNVFARALGLPNDPIEATAVLLDALSANRSRAVNLGRADERWFLFGAGFGFDAAVIAAVEQARRRGSKSTNTLYVRTALREYARAARARPTIRLIRPDRADQGDLHFVIVSNTSPWTYLGNRPVTPTPQASFDSELDVYARRSMSPASVAKGLRQMLVPEITPSGRDVLVEHDVARLSLATDEPQPFHVDGDYLGLRSRICFHAVPRALSVVC